MWIHIKDQVPPHDKLVLVRGTHHWTNQHEPNKTYSYKVYAIAFNYAGPPVASMLQVVQQEQGDVHYTVVPFKIEEWMVLE